MWDNDDFTRALNVYEEVNREAPLNGLHWFIDHAETISQRNMERIKALGGGIVIQNRMAFQGEYFRDRYGEADGMRGIKVNLEIQFTLLCGEDAGTGKRFKKHGTGQPEKALQRMDKPRHSIRTSHR